MHRLLHSSAYDWLGYTDLMPCPLRRVALSPQLIAAVGTAQNDQSDHQVNDESGASDAGRFPILQEPNTSTLLCFFVFLQGQEMQAPATSACCVK